MHVDGKICLIDYIKDSEGTIFLTHTEVPYGLQGRGYGMELVKKSLEDVERHGFTVVPSCSFVAAYIRRHPEWERILMPGVVI